MNHICTCQSSATGRSPSRHSSVVSEFPLILWEPWICATVSWLPPTSVMAYCLSLSFIIVFGTTSSLFLLPLMVSNVGCVWVLQWFLDITSCCKEGLQVLSIIVILLCFTNMSFANCMPMIVRTRQLTTSDFSALSELYLYGMCASMRPLKSSEKNGINLTSLRATIMWKFSFRAW